MNYAFEFTQCVGLIVILLSPIVEAVRINPLEIGNTYKYILHIPISRKKNNYLSFHFQEKLMKYFYFYMMITIVGETISTLRLSKMEPSA